MSIKDQIDFHPVRSLSGLLAFGAAVITGLAYNQEWTGEAVGLISATWSAFIALLGTFFVSGKTTPNADLDRIVHDTIVELAPFTPVVTEAIVPIASSPLIDTTVTVADGDGTPNTR